MNTIPAPSAPDAPARTAERLEFDGYLLDPAAATLCRDGVRIDLNYKAFALLLALARAAGDVVPRDVLLQSAWRTADVADANLRVQMSTLRKVLAEHGSAGRYVESVAGRGYCFVVPVRRIPADGGQPPPAGDLLLGRDEAVSRIARLLQDKGLVTLAGPRGVGKSAVARAVAARLAAMHWSVVTLDLAAAAAELPAGLSAGLSAELPAMAGDRPALLVLENCEYHTDGAAALVHELAQRQPGVAVLAVSRESLQLARETVYRLPPLALPPRGAGMTLADACQYPAVQLFCDRARARNGDFHVADDDVPELVEQCQALDGLPLALELAARRTAWHRGAGPAAAVSMTAMPAMTAMSATTAKTSATSTPSPASRQQSMWASLDWSYQRLGAREQLALGRLAVFRDAFGLISVTGALTCCGVPEAQVLPTLQSLVAKSLVMVERGPAFTLYRLLDSTKAYALERYVARREPCQARYPTALRDLPPVLLLDRL